MNHPPVPSPVRPAVRPPGPPAARTGLAGGPVRLDVASLAARSRRARRRDRRVYTHSHPLLFALLAATRRRPVVRLGRTLLVHGTAAYHEALTRVPLDRTASGTTGGAAAELTAGDVLFDQDGAEHRTARRALSASLNTAALQRIRPHWQAVLTERIPERADGDLDLGIDLDIDLVALARELAGVTAAALTGATGCPHRLAHAAAEAAAHAARDHLPGLRRRGPGAAAAAARLTALLPGPCDAMVVVAAVNTTVSAVPRAVAWCADAGLWPAVNETTAPRLAAELLRLTAPSPLLPRVAAADTTLAGHPVRAGDRLILVARHAARAHRRPPAGDPTAVSRDATQAVFGAGPHACPGAGLARTQLADVLLALAPLQPVVTRARVDRRSALPGYAELTLRPGRP
ncbi:cytochrome P450 [Kitasatospora sp. NPDC059599]|uniref:cytochrome P450 n=1 Tax=Kitasatospora sp. NPDC059599 TaxID=3346880 RepID=UPI0036844D30